MVKCGYCDFNSFAGSSQHERERVVAAMQRELELRRCRPQTIFLGGGTPTYLDLALLEQLLETIARCDLSACREWTCEANPESCDTQTLQLLVDHGVTRFSIGIQSWDPARLEFLDRPHDRDAAERAYECARATGAAVSLDFIFGVPGQTLAAWQQELEHAIELSPDHLSCYQLTFEAGTKLDALRARGIVEAASDEHLRDLLLWTRSRLTEAGYLPYEVSNYARPGQECQHNLGYWRGNDYVGIGPGAASHDRGRRSTNLRPLRAYCEAISTSGCASFDAELLTPEQRTREMVWLGLRTREGPSFDRIHERTGVDVETLLATELADATQRDDITRTETGIRVPESRIPWLDAIAANFLAAAASTSV
ncbi:MAG: radical SAM family heme chaperone HemW [Planctomycetes bacterium]|nr:radical SAM family heme chaperone HemW [Planctomycetota bacterium]